MSLRMQVILLIVLFGLANSAKPKEHEQKKQCVDNTLYAKYACEHQKDGVKILVPGKCSEYYECSNGLSKKKTCPKFFDPKTQKCVSQSTCVEVDNTDCIIPTPPPCSGKPPTPAPPTPAPPTPAPPTPAPPTPSTPCECPAPTPPPTCPAPPSCPPPIACPKPPSCPPPTECPAPPTCPGYPVEPPVQPPVEPPVQPPVQPPVEPPTVPTPKPPCPPPSGGPCGNWFNPNDLYGSFVCKNKADGTKLIAPSSCRDYYYCIGGHSYRKSCGSNYYFDPKVGACDLKSNVHCPSETKLVL